MLRTKLFRGFVILVVIFGALSALVGVRTINRHVLKEAQKRVRIDLNSAWAVYNSRLREMESVLRLAAEMPAVTARCEKGTWFDPELRNRLERIRVSYGLDFLDVVSPEGQMVVRTAPPYKTGDYRLSCPMINAALKGKTASGTTVLTREELTNEGEGLADRAFLQLEQVPHARFSPRKEETRGMAMASAVPVSSGSQVVGAIYGGILVNRNFALVDQIHRLVYGEETYNGTPMGTATIFLHDCRVATTVRLANGNRAIGTIISREVGDAVLDNGRSWVDDAFVVRDWYLTAYDPIRNYSGDVIGMLYVGILKRPFLDYRRQVLIEYAVLSVFALLIAVVLAFMIAGRIARPIHTLVEASKSMSAGQRVDVPVPGEACSETRRLINAFNEMSRTLAEREESLRTLNHSYMETLGFVSHELRSPLASMLNYVYLLHEKKLGPLTEKQERAVEVLDRNLKRLVEMVRHYLNLSRIEQGTLEPSRTQVKIQADVLTPLLEALRAEMEARRQQVENRVGAEVEVDADMNMTREIFENLLGNASKYGRDGGRIVVGAREGGPFVQFSIWNEGDGIPRGREQVIFEKFRRGAGTEAASKAKGTGLGLFITKAIVEAHGGRIEARSEPGQWAEFLFTLPRAGSPAAAGAAERKRKEDDRG